MEVWLSIASFIIILLLGIVAYFLKSLHSDLKGMMLRLEQLAIRLSTAESNSKSGYRELRGDMNDQNNRITRLESIVFKLNQES